MKTQITVLGIVLCLHLLGSGEAQGQGISGLDSKQFTERMAGCAESVDGVLYVMSGMSLSANLADVGAYDPLAKTWTAKTAIPTPRSTTASAVFGNDIYVVGGRYENNILSVVEKYRTAEDTWMTCAPMPTARWSLMACNADNKVYVFGGISGIGNDRRALDIVEAYDPRNDSWQSIGKMPEARQGAAIAAVNGIIYVISGKTASYAEVTAGDQITEHVDSFDPKTSTWTRVKDIPTSRVGAKAVVTNGLIFVVGGIAKGGDFPTEIDVFDPRSNQWSAGPRLSSGRSGHMCALVGDSIIVFGGSSVSYGSGKPSISGSMETISLSAYHQKQGADAGTGAIKEAVSEDQPKTAEVLTGGTDQPSGAVDRLIPPDMVLPTRGPISYLLAFASPILFVIALALGALAVWLCWIIISRGLRYILNYAISQIGILGVLTGLFASIIWLPIACGVVLLLMVVIPFALVSMPVQVWIEQRSMWHVALIVCGVPIWSYSLYKAWPLLRKLAVIVPAFLREK